MLIFSQPTHEEIAACAYFIYLNEGCPAGQQAEHWRQAEEQLVADRMHDALVMMSKGEKTEEEGSGFLVAGD